MSFADTTPEDIVQLGQAIGLVGTDGQLDTGWFGEAADRLGAILTDDGQREATIAVARSLLGTVTDDIDLTDVAADSWIPIVDTSHDGIDVSLYLVVDDTVDGRLDLTIGGRLSGRPSDDLIASATFSVPLVSFDTENGGAQILGGDAEIGATLTFPNGISPGAPAPVDLDGVTISGRVPFDAPQDASLSVLLRNLRFLGQEVGTDIGLDALADTLGADAIEIGLGLVQARLADLIPEVRHLLALLGLNPQVPEIPSLPLDDVLIGGVEALRQWLLDLVSDGAAIDVWLTRFRDLLGLAPDTLSGSGTGQDPFSLCLEGPTWQGCLTLTVTPDPATGAVTIVPGVVAHVDSSGTLLNGRVEAEVALARFVLGPVPTAESLPEVEVRARLLGDQGPLVDVTMPADSIDVTVGSVALGIGRRSGIIVPAFEAENVAIDAGSGADIYPVVDLTSAEALSNIAGNALDQILGDIVAGLDVVNTPQGRALAALAGLVAPGGAPADWPALVDVVELFSAPAATIACYHVRVIEADPANWSLLAAEVGVLLQAIGTATPSVTGGGTEPDPWLVTLFDNTGSGDPVTGAVALAAWTSPAPDAVSGPRLHLALRAQPQPIAVAGLDLALRYEAHLLHVGLPPAAACPAPATVELMGCHTLRAALPGPVVLAADGLELLADSVSAAVRWCGGDDLQTGASVVNPRVVVDAVPITLPDIDLAFGLDLPEIDFSAVDWDAIRILVGPWFSGGGTLGDWLPRLGSLLGWLPSLGDITIRFPQLPGLDLQLPAVDWPALDLERLALGDFGGALLDWLGNLFGDGGGDFPDLSFGLIGWLSSLLGGLGDFDLPDGPGPLELQVNGSGTYEDPWCLPVVDGGPALLVWLDPDGPSWAGVAGLAANLLPEELLDAVDGAGDPLSTDRLAELLEQGSALVPELRNKLSGVDVPAALAGLRAAVLDGDGLVGAAAQVPDGWASVDLEPTVHLLEPSGFAAADHLPPGAAPPARRVFVTTDLPGLDDLAWPGETEVKQVDMTEAGLVPEAFDLTGVSGDGPWFVRLPPRSGAAVTQPAENPTGPELSGIEGLTGRLRRVLDHIRTQVDGDLAVIAHSTAGQIARLVAADAEAPISDLVTIGTPHLAAEIGFLDELDPGEGIRLLQRLRDTVEAADLPSEAGALLDLLDTIGSAVDGVDPADLLPLDDFTDPPDFGSVAAAVQTLAVAGRVVPADIDRALAALAKAGIEHAVGLLPTGGVGGDGITHLGLGIKLDLAIGDATPGQVRADVGLRADLAHIELQPGESRPVPRLRLHTELRRNEGWLARGPGLAPPIDLPRDPRVRWAEIDLDLILNPDSSADAVDGSVRIVLHDASIFGVTYETWVIDDKAVVEAIGDADALADGVSSLVPEARVLLGEIIAQLGPLPVAGPLRLLAELLAAARMAEIDDAGNLTLPPDPLERFLVDPVAEIEARLGPGDPDRSAVIDALRRLLGGTGLGDEIIVPVGPGLELLVEVGTAALGDAIAPTRHRLTLRTTGDGFVIGDGAIEIEGQASLDETGELEVHLDVGAAVIVGAVGRTVVEIDGFPLEVRLVADGGVVPAIPSPIDLLPIPDTAATIDAFKRFLLDRVLEHGLRVLARADDAVDELAGLLLSPLPDGGEFAFRYVSRLLHRPKDWLLDPALLGDGSATSPLPTPSVARLQELADMVRELLGQGSAPTGSLDLPWGLAVAVGPGPGGDRAAVSLAWNPPPADGIVSATAELSLDIGPCFEITPTFGGSAVLDPLPGAFASAGLDIGVDANGTVSAGVTLTGSGAPIVVGILPTASGLDALAGQAAQQLLPLVLDAIAADPTIGSAVATIGDQLALRTGGADPTFDPAAVVALADTTASDLLARINGVIASGADELLTALGELLSQVVDGPSIVVDPSGPSITVTPFDVDGTTIEVVLGLPVTGFELCVEAAGVEPVEDQLRVDLALCISATATAGFSFSAEVIDDQWLEVGSVSFLPHVAVRIGDEADPGEDRVEVGLWLEELPSSGERRGVFLIAPFDDTAEVVCRTETAATPRIYSDVADLDACLVDALLTWLVPLAGDLVIDIGDVTALLQKEPLGGTNGPSLGDRLVSAGILRDGADGDPFDLDPGLFDPAEVGDRLLALAVNLLDGVTLPDLDPFEISIQTDDAGNRTRFGIRVALTEDVVLFTGDGFRLSLRNDATWLDSLADGITVFFVDARRNNLTQPRLIAPVIDIGGLGLRVDEPGGGVLIDLLATLEGFDLSVGLRADLGPPSGPAADLAAVRIRLEELTIPMGAAGSEANPVAAKLLSSSSEDNTAGDGEELAPALTPEITIDFAPDAGIAFGLAGQSFPVWIPIQRSFGPIYVEQIGASLLDPDGQEPKGQILLDGGVSIEGFSVGVDDLSLAIPLNDPGNLSLWEVGLAGLGIGYEADGISIAGGFRFIDGQYAGMLQVQVAEFGITAIGAYGEFPELPGQATPTYTSMFIFGVLSAPLGGIPPFFVTAIGAGVGLNRRLAIPAEVEDVADFSLVSAMESGSDFARDPLDALDGIVADFPVDRGTFWLAAGVRFTSFALVETVAVLTVEIGDHLEVNVLGLSQAVLPRPELPLASIEMALRARFSTDEMVLSVQAQLTDNSFILTPSARLTGGFAFVIFFRTGDFVFTLGGYHPRFDKPSSYPEVPRLGFEWSVSNVLSIKGGTYFALTSSCVMAGGSLEASYDAGFAWASLTIGADALLSWDPFFYDVGVYIRVSAGVKIRICFFACATIRLSFSIGVDVFVTGPELSGKATLDLDVMSVTVRFGASNAASPPPLTWSEFKLKYLQQGDASDPSVGLSVVRGLQAGEPATTSAETPPDDGTAAHPWRVLPEFEFVTSTRAASSRLEFIGTVGSTDVEVLTGRSIDIRPMARDNISSTHIVTVTPTGLPGGRDVDPSKLDLFRITQPVPTGTWEYVAQGSEVAEAKTFDALVGWRVVVSPEFQQTVENEIEIDQIQEGDPHPLPFHEEIGDRPNFAAIALAAGEFALAQPNDTFGAVGAARTSLAGASAFGQRVFSAELAAPPRLSALGQGMVDRLKEPAGLDPVGPIFDDPTVLQPGRPRLEGVLRSSPAGARIGGFQTSVPARARTDLAKGRLGSVEMPTLASVQAELGGIPARLVLTGSGVTSEGRTVQPLGEAPPTTAPGANRSVVRGRRTDFASAGSLDQIDKALGDGAPLVAGDVQVWRVPGSRFDAPGRPAGEPTDLQGTPPQPPTFAAGELEGGVLRHPARAAGRSEAAGESVESTEAGQGSRPRWAVDGDQLTRTVVLGRAGTVLADHVGQRYTMPLPVGADRVVSVGVGRVGGGEAAPGVAGWQLSTRVARVGPGTFLAPRAAIRVPDRRIRRRRLRGGGTLGLVPAGQAVGDAPWVETRLPADTQAVALLLELPAGTPCTDRLLDELAMSLEGATRTDRPPIVTAVGQRLVAVYAVQPDGADVDAVRLTVAHSSSWRLAGVMGAGTDAGELADDLMAHDPSTLGGALIEATGGESKIRLELPGKPGPGEPYGDRPDLGEGPWSRPGPRALPGRRKWKVPARPARRVRAAARRVDEGTVDDGTTPGKPPKKKPKKRPSKGKPAKKQPSAKKPRRKGTR